MEYRHEYPLETCMFSTHQLHTEEALRVAVQTGMGHLASRWMSLPSMIKDHLTALVVINADVVWRRDFDYFTDTSMTFLSRLRVRPDGKILRFLGEIYAAGQRRLVADFSVRPVRLSGSAAFDAVPGYLERSLVERFVRAEMDPVLRSRGLAEEVERIATEGSPIGTCSTTFKIRRTDCEFAEQWRFTRLPVLIAPAREMIAVKDKITVGLAQPTRRFRGEWWRPMYLHDNGRVDLQVIRHDGDIHFVYRVWAIERAGQADSECALALETYEPSA